MEILKRAYSWILLFITRLVVKEKLIERLKRLKETGKTSLIMKSV